MNAILMSITRTLLAGVALVVALAFAVGHAPVDHALGVFVVRWLHVLAGIVWLGLLWYFNVVQIPSMTKIADAHKPAVVGVIAPLALRWFRWAAVATVASGLLLAAMLGELGAALALRAPVRAIGIGMWLALVMAFNVWFVIWPLQKRVLGLVPAEPAQRAAAARRATLVSRINLALSLPMLYCMLAQPHAGL